MKYKRLFVHTFELGTDSERAEKVVEEAHELCDAFYMNCDENELMMEIGDVITIAVNFATALGIDVQRCIDMVEAKNIIRGRYD